MAITGSFSTVRAQAPQTAAFNAAFTYVEDLLRESSPARRRLREIAVGSSERIELGHGAYAIEQVYASKPRAEGFFESHRRYIDVQVIVEGCEQMEVVDVARAVVRDPYNEERDFLIYQDAHDASVVKLRAGEVAVFFPVDIHMPSLRLGAAAVVVRKTVVKVPVGA